ncbi:hypothetical protein [Micromonospora sp. NPDC005707]|uniref:hypothetical protein n=1 Tax=Micromonospora sp. NPDC005707 TaxID=3157050 RepID=UPI0033DE3C2C
MKAHRTDIVSFAFGLAFLGLSAWWLLARILGLALPPVGWFLAGALILIGLLGLVGALRSGRHTEAAPAESTVSAPYETGTPAGAGPAGEAVAPTGEEADEWATDAVADAPLAAREDRPFDEEPRWSPGAPEVGSDRVTRELPPVEPAPQDRAEPATRELSAAEERDGTTRELPAAEERDDTAGPATRELPVVDEAADRPGGGPRTGGDGPG